MLRPTRAPRLLLALAGLALVGGCANDPGAVLIPLPERAPDPAALAAVPATTPDGYPNVVATPVVVGGAPLGREAQSAAEKSLEGSLAGTRRKPPAMSTSAAALAQVGATHVEEARAAIDAPPPAADAGPPGAAPSGTSPPATAQ